MATKEQLQDVLVEAGRMAELVRHLVGGKDINGFRRSPAKVDELGLLIPTLQTSVDKYDRMIMDLAEKE